MKHLFVLSAVLALIATGCATDIGQTARKSGVTTIAVEPRLDVDQPMRIGFQKGTGNLNMMLAELIVDEMYSKRLTAFKSNMQQNGIDVTDMARQKTAVMLREQKGFTVVTNAADAVLVVAVKQYGFDGAGFSISRDVPFIVLRAELIQRGKRIWRGEGQAHPMRSDGLGARSEEYAAKPELLRQHWEIQVDRALRELLMAEAGK